MNHWNVIGLLILWCIHLSVGVRWDQIGCYKDKRHEWAFFWWGPGTEYESQSATSCSQYCHNQKFLYAGMGGAKGLDCHCGNGAYDIYGDSNGCTSCNTKGEWFQCGRKNGDDRLLYVYKIDPPVEIDTRHIGCWKSDYPPDVLDNYPLKVDGIQTDSITVDHCIDGCREASHIYIGIWKGNECWCGNDLQWQANGRNPAHTSQCSLKCTGNSTELCGGEQFISIYRAECIDGKYGLQGEACQPCNCLDDAICNKKTGQCPDDCKLGYTPSSIDGPCVACKDKYYGFHCNSTCNCNTACDKVTGECNGSCNEGWMKKHSVGPCSLECPEGKYGSGCGGQCNCEDPCDKRSGQCHGNCTQGWVRPVEGGPCSSQLPTTPNEETTPSQKVGDIKNIGIGAGVGAAALLILVALIVVFIRKRRSKDNQESDLIPEGSVQSRSSVLAEDIYESGIIDTDPEGNNTLYPVSKLMEVMKSRNEEEKPFCEEFQNLHKGNMKDWDLAEDHPLREVKNRFGNIFPYNENRIILESSNENDYINASYIKNYAGKIGYIAAQGPVTSTVDDFLHMVWQEKVSKIVMVTNLIEEGKEKCEQYWPKDNEPADSEREVVLKKTDELVYPDYVVRTFTMTKGTEKRQLKHYMFSGWGDHEGLTYASSILSLLEMVKNDKFEAPAFSNGHLPNAEEKNEGREDEVEEENLYDNDTITKKNTPKRESTASEPPLLVHCSAGVGRTGTFIALDYLLDQAKSEEKIDVFECVHKLREQRVNMVQSLDQYRFLYIALLKALVIGPTSTACYNFETALKDLEEQNPETHKSKLYTQYEALDVLKPKYKKTEVTDATKQENKSKNRSQDYLPSNRYRPTFVTAYKGSTGYINAVAVKGYKTKFTFLATQLPLEVTRPDFWCMAFDYQSPVIVSLHCPEEQVYWPQVENESISYGEFTVECLTTQSIKRHKIKKLTLSVRHQDKHPKTTIFLQVDWPADVSLIEAETFFALNDLIIAHQHGKSTLPVIIQCMFGHTRSGLVCALNCLIDMINAEQQADVFQCVQHVRSTKPDFIHSFEQYKFLYSSTVKYISTMDSYANFKKL